MKNIYDIDFFCIFACGIAALCLTINIPAFGWLFAVGLLAIALIRIQTWEP